MVTAYGLYMFISSDGTLPDYARPGVGELEQESNGT